MQKHVNLVDLVKSFPTNIFLQNLASIQKRTSPIQFAHLAEKSEKSSISNLSTKAQARGGGRATHLCDPTRTSTILVAGRNASTWQTQTIPPTTRAMSRKINQKLERTFFQPEPSSSIKGLEYSAGFSSILSPTSVACQ